jgi:hypothetical protein
MRQRCNNPNCRDYRWYGGKGVTVCEEWNDFINFYSDMGDPPGPGYSIDRIDPTKGYSKDNCRWATHRQQVNNCSSNVLISYNGETKSAGEWSKDTGIPEDALRQRKRLGWSDEEVITTPHRKSSKSRVTAGSVRAKCAANGVPYSTYVYRKKRGWSEEEALRK